MSVAMGVPVISSTPIVVGVEVEDPPDQEQNVELITELREKNELIMELQRSNCQNNTDFTNLLERCEMKDRLIDQLQKTIMQLQLN